VARLAVAAREAEWAARCVRAFDALGAEGLLDDETLREIEEVRPAIGPLVTGGTESLERLWDAAQLWLETIPIRTERADGLSPREMEVLRLIAQGCTNREIAETLTISLNTVARHVSNIFDKIGVANRTEAAAHAHRSERRR